MKLRYFVGTPEDAFRKHDIVFTSVEAADTHAMRGDTLCVYRATSLLALAKELLLVLDMEDISKRFSKIYKGRGLDREPNIYWFIEEFAERLVRLRQRSKLKEAA